MSRRPAVALLLSALALAGCGTGLEAQTYQGKGRTDGAVADLGGRTGVTVRNVHITAPAHGSILEEDALVVGGLVNNGTTPDALTGAITSFAEGVELVNAGTPVAQIALPALGAADQTWGVQLKRLTKTLHVGQHITITLIFQRAGSVTLTVPVRTGDNGLADREVMQDPYGGHEAKPEGAAEHK